MKKIITTLTLILAATIAHAQSFEGIMRFELTVTPDDDMQWATGATLKIKGKNVYAVNEFKSGDVSESIYLGDKDKHYLKDDIKKKYLVNYPEQPYTKVTKTNETKTILGYKCIKYVVELNSTTSGTYWITNEIRGVDCKI